MIKSFQTLSSKLVSILLAFFCVALIAISLTLYVSWQLEGGAAAINDAGSERMRSYRLAYLLTYNIYFGLDQESMEGEVHREMAAFEKTLMDLEQGDPSRPLLLPKDVGVRRQMANLRLEWQGHIRPLLEGVLNSHEPEARHRLLKEIRPSVENYVGLVNGLVLSVERDNAYKTSLLRSIQLGLVMLAIVGTVILIFLMYLLIIRPATKLQEGIQRMAGEDFSVRVPVENRDEFGALALGFNQMADHLEGLYNTLEQRVETKTHSLEEKNQELGLLYEVTALLNEPAAVEELSRRFIRRLMTQFNAEGGAVRLVDPSTQKIHLVVTEGLSDDFAQKESCLNMGECLCGGAASSQTPAFFDLHQPTELKLMYNCRDEGYRSVSVFTIKVKKRLIGIFNLYFLKARGFTPMEVHLLEAVGQHLGAAIEGQRLVSREKEMAISEERNLLAQELHDSIAQGLAFLNIQIQMLEDSFRKGNDSEVVEGLSHIREGVQESYDDVRELLVHFRTRVHQSDLEGAIRSSLEKFEGQTGIKATLNISGEGAPLDTSNETQVLHIVQEALSNIRKHAAASNVTVEISRNGDFVISVRDNGHGFNPELQPGDSHVGISIMKERAHRIGGQLGIVSRVGTGTEIRLTLDKSYKEAA
ncbi:MAG: type IV pili methyl-accepting chemotaxis transducer N-terminal domain-containing protein [Sulfuricella denitrificans]|nr:type IV pili methyl-accepting chemotaxis transducer N-terminal domain-containing protein [Sulfuricella denitrificans]